MPFLHVAAAILGEGEEPEEGKNPLLHQSPEALGSTNNIFME